MVEYLLIDNPGTDSAKKSILRLEKAISKNVELRLRYPDQPEKFIDSEADLDEAILDLQHFSMQPTLAFPVLFALGSLESIVNLLTHENKDIVIDVIQVISEWTDEDLVNGVEKSDFDDLDILKSLITHLKDLSFFELLGHTLLSFSENVTSEILDSEREGVNKVLTIVENICSIDHNLAFEISTEMNLLPYLFSRIQNSFLTQDEAKLARIDNNQQYSCEVLSILTQSSPKICTVATQPLSKDISLSGLEILLNCISKYRKIDPIDEAEYEYLENLFNVIISMMISESNSKQLFIDAEGVELVCLMLKESTFTNFLSLKLLDFLLTPLDPKLDYGIGQKALSIFLDCGGYQHLCRSLMKHRVVNILSWLFRFTRANTKYRWLLLSKFACHNEADSKVKLACNARLDRLVELHLFYTECIEQNEYNQNSQAHVEDPEVGLNMVDCLISIVALNDNASKAHLSKAVELKQSSLQNIKNNVINYIFDLFSDSENTESGDDSKNEENATISLNSNISKLSFDQVYEKINTDLKELYLAAKIL
ncbi:hypothetical protein BB561_001071 [Smittium simulii]|uniref:Beta-catenin-like protein 1 N-terminal domain-containing protein n=1 Tax=Smittium simulii TaxID=133385 RepID=A0A2T9YWA0_9FUNG|nr:hypothetical protein BB561_001071 [Smittium simulii]